jgi:hypothetical protein
VRFGRGGERAPGADIIAKRGEEEKEEASGEWLEKNDKKSMAASKVQRNGTVLGRGLELQGRG